MRSGAIPTATTAAPPADRRRAGALRRDRPRSIPARGPVVVGAGAVVPCRFRLRAVGFALAGAGGIRAAGAFDAWFLGHVELLALPQGEITPAMVGSLPGGR